MNRRVSLGRRLVVVLVFAVVAVWASVAFLQEAYLGHQLGRQAAALQQQNAAIATQNEGYRRDIEALQSGAGSEEQARLNGYARPDEKVYLVGQPPPQSTTRSVAPKPAAPSGNILDAIRRWFGNLWH